MTQGGDILCTVLFKFLKKRFPGLCSHSPWERLRSHQFSPPLNLVMCSRRRGVRLGCHITVTVSCPAEKLHEKYVVKEIKFISAVIGVSIEAQLLPTLNLPEQQFQGDMNKSKTI